MPARQSSAPPACTIVWFRQDLRLADNPALTAAMEKARESGGPVLPLYILDEETPDIRSLGGASKWWLHHALADLQAQLEKLGLPLILRRGEAQTVLFTLLSELQANAAVYWNRLYDAGTVGRDRSIKEALKARGYTARSFNSYLLCEPWDIATKSGTPFKVYTPFWRTLAARGDPPTPRSIPCSPLPEAAPKPDEVPSDDLAAWGLLPRTPDWADGFSGHWQVGEAAAHDRLDHFLQQTEAYDSGRDHPAKDATSRLSPYLHFGQIGPRQIWHAAQQARHAGALTDASADKLLQELAWREFAYHLLYHFPDFPRKNWKEAFDAFPWAEDPDGLRHWQRGETGYPIVDAGMRQLWRSGWMHNRVRMIAASFLIKDLLVHWKEGEAWFWDTLVDADHASNPVSWQWVAGSGADASPYFRIFNPVTQGEKFDPQGNYVRQWLPELAELPDKYIHKPWEAPQSVLDQADISLGKTYPRPIVDHGAARKRALSAYQTIKTG